MDVDTELSSDTNNVRRKRPLVAVALLDSGSDTETEVRAAAKCSSARRGKLASRGRGSLAQAKAELKAKAEEAREEAFERSLRSRAFRKGTPKVVLDPEESASDATGDPTKLGVEELRAQAGRNAALILEDGSGGDSPLRADNGHLRKEIEDLKSELKAHRREFTEMRTTVAAANDSVANTTRDAQALEELKASIVSAVGAINARLNGIEECLPPVKEHHPPLAADKRRELMQPNGPTYSQAAQTTSPPFVSPTPKRVAAPVRKPVAPAVPPTPIVGPSVASTAPESQSWEAQESSWSTVVKKGRKGKKPSPTAFVPTTAAPMEPIAPQAPKPKLATPRTAAVIVTLQPEAQVKGVTYAHVLERAEQGVKLQDFDICGGLKVLRSATGAKSWSCLGRSRTKQKSLPRSSALFWMGWLTLLTGPTMKVDLRVTGLDDSVTREKLIAAVARERSCPVEAIRCGEMSRGPGYMGIARVTCPIAVAKKLSDSGRLLVGWSPARVHVLEQRPLRCFKCMGLGHTKALCPSRAERAGLCFRCGVDGHKSAGCTGKLRCAVCADAGKPSGHMMGSRECIPPITNFKVVLGTQTTSNVGRHQAEEEAAMSS
ncbi:uncharacterized protein LOC126776681 [Nymphalis io]|uniref:uncharacterized protein LOC126776681 n=1 Tax=Inachis io TaxID=171585 RepID=UPI0021671787|nr:uncharacterized protein LOC126776681 [Nymphalis io]